jgi:two-component system cell cycle response regulator
MQNKPIKTLADCQILVVDDEKSICDFLKAALSGTYGRIDACLDAQSAISSIGANDYDLIITDLKLPDLSGIDVLRCAKLKDEYIEVMIITGYASIESASVAINLGVTSYMLKPLNLNDLLAQVAKAIGIRIFHLKSLFLMERSDTIVPEARGHLHDITSLYYFSRKLMLPLEIAEIMRIVLEETNGKFGALFCAVGVNFLGFNEIFAMPCHGEVDRESVRKALQANWSGALDILDKKAFKSDGISLTLFKGGRGRQFTGTWGEPFTLSMTVLGRDIGFLAVFGEKGVTLSEEKRHFLYVFTSMVSSIIEHGYVDMQAKRQAKTDSLTGIANHRLFHESLEREISRADRNHDTFCLAIIDIDDFKKVNDTYGHLVGDAVLIDLTQRISAMIRRGDLLARYGGEEFALVLPDTELNGAAILADRICHAIADDHFSFSGKQLHYTISIGLALYDGARPHSKDSLIGVADEALYQSKREGKNRVSIK